MSEDKTVVSLKLDLENPDTVEAIARVAYEISLRYRNGLTLVGVSSEAGDVGEIYLKALSAALLACKCRHMETVLETKTFAIDGKPVTAVVNSPSPHLFVKKPTVLAVPELDKNTPYFGTWLMSKGVRKLEISTFRCKGAAPDWLNPAYIAFLEEPAETEAPAVEEVTEVTEV